MSNKIKMIQCKNCFTDISSKAKVCPSCGEPNKKPFYKKLWFWVLIVILIGLGSEDTTVTTDESSQITETETNNNESLEEVNDYTEYEKEEDDTELDIDTNVIEENKDKEDENTATDTKEIPTEYKSALKKAKIYSSTLNMSKAGLYEQLTSEYGEKFSKESAQYAIDNIDVDWKENALKKAIVF